MLVNLVQQKAKGKIINPQNRSYFQGNLSNPALAFQNLVKSVWQLHYDLSQLNVSTTKSVFYMTLHQTDRDGIRDYQ